MSEVQYLSKEKYNELEKELEQLKSEGRKDVAERLKAAKALGDLSENSEYQEAKQAQEDLETKINQLDNILRNAEIIKKSEQKDVVSVGSKVKVKKDGKSIEYTIVGSSESNPSEGFISNESPVGKNLLGKQKGDKVEIKTPKGKTNYDIVSVS